MKERSNFSTKNLKKCTYFLSARGMATFFFFACMLSLNAEGLYSQASISLNETNITLKNVFERIEQVSDYVFLVSDKAAAELNRRVEINSENEDVEKVLDQVLGETDLSYLIVGRQISIYRDNAASETTPAIAQPLPVQQQSGQIAVRGTVTDENGEAAIGATIQIRGTSQGTVTDIDGNFSIMAPEGSTLIISYVGYITQELRASADMRITLQTDLGVLDELVVVGYGTLRRSDLTGAISSVNVNELASRATTNPAEALQGKVAGVNIRRSGGNAGASVSVRIRGVTSFTNNEPLYIIDGFPGDINSINPQDIASMEILKDGAAAAIYGSTAANGVILVTTKNGQRGEIKVDFNSFINFTQVARRFEMLDAAGYVQVHRQMYDNFNAQTNNPVALPGYLTNPGAVNTNWQDEVFRSGISQNYMVSLRGGSQNARYSVSYNRADEKGILLGNRFAQNNARMRLSATKNIFDVDANFGFRATQSNQPQYSLREVYMITPLIPVLDDTREFGFGLTDSNGLPNNRNPLADNHFRTAGTDAYNITGSAALTINFTEWLNFRTSYSYRGNHQHYKYHTPPYVSDIRAIQEFPVVSENKSYWQEQVIDNVLTFNNRFEQHSVNVMAGTSTTMQDYNWNTAGVEGFTLVDGRRVPAGFLDPNFNTINAGRGGTFNAEGSRTEYRRVSFFSRLNYSYASKYLLQATLRSDGSSKFGRDSRWGTFPSVALGWRISGEDFFPQDGLFSNLKLRASWGRLGSEQALGFYDFQALIVTRNNLAGGYVQGSESMPWPGSTSITLANSDLQWETTDTKNIGFDFGLLRQRLTGSVNYYYNQTEDMLIRKMLPPSVGLSNPVLNVGKIRNTGAEIEIGWSDKIGNFAYNAGFNFTTISNKVVRLADAEQALLGTGLVFGTEHFPTQTRQGKPIAGFYLYRTDGIFQNEAEVAAHVNSNGVLLQRNARPGDIRFIDVNGDGVINDDDKEYFGSAIPKVEANFSFGASYKGVDLAFNLGSAWGHKLYNANRYFYEGMSSGSNFMATTLNAWTPQNTNTTMPRAVLGDINRNARESDRFLEKGNFVRLRMLQLGYTLPESMVNSIHIERLRIYASGENLFTITSYKGTDPEFSRDVLNGGVDTHVFPFTRSFILGLQLTF
jgi:TonB-linked SusC/RagA family outer membrane protein